MYTGSLRSKENDPGHFVIKLQLVHDPDYFLNIKGNQILL
jgi:hypothetical protein